MIAYPCPVKFSIVAAIFNRGTPLTANSPEWQLSNIIMLFFVLIKSVAQLGHHLKQNDPFHDGMKNKNKRVFMCCIRENCIN